MTSTSWLTLSVSMKLPRSYLAGPGVPILWPRISPTPQASRKRFFQLIGPNMAKRPGISEIQRSSETVMCVSHSGTASREAPRVRLISVNSSGRSAELSDLDRVIWKMRKATDKKAIAEEKKRREVRKAIARRRLRSCR